MSSGQQSYGYGYGNGNWPKLFPVYHQVVGMQNEMQGLLWVMGTRSDRMTGGSSYLIHHVPAPLIQCLSLIRLFAFDWFQSLFVFHEGRSIKPIDVSVLYLLSVLYISSTTKITYCSLPRCEVPKYFRVGIFSTNQGPGTQSRLKTLSQKVTDDEGVVENRSIFNISITVYHFLVFRRLMNLSVMVITSRTLSQ